MLLITGSTGNLGSSIIDFLLRKGMSLDGFAGFARNEVKANQLRIKGVIVHMGNYDNYDSLVKAMKGVKTLLMISGSEIDKRIRQHENIINAAVENKVKHILYTSFHRKDDESDSPIAAIADAHIKAENEIMKSGINYTFLRNALYAEIVPMFLGGNAIASGIYIPAANGKVPYALRSDLAEATANILLHGNHEGRIYSMVHTVNYSFYNIAEMLSRITGKKVTYTSPSEEQYITTLKNAGVSDHDINGMISWARGIKEGYFESGHSDLEMLLGRSPQSLDVFLKSQFRR